MDFIARMRVLAETVLVTPRLRLEPLTPAHAPELFDGLRAPALYAFIPQEPPASLDHVLARFERISRRGPADGSAVWLNWAFRTEEHYCGLFEATALADGTVDIAYFVFLPDQRQGLAREAGAAVMAALWADADTQVIGASLDTRNEASAKLLESLGFTRVAVTENADFFGGMASDEYRYECRR
ncbi:GNAT family N-acetyltransferase [Devosia aquimaris]|uniref:GNAT family N-acetyltransferase n=1 Tax=Devosia aquimaris TaxID=2866214 RepID=UPI001CD0E346|nr:GNAT family protein [Devosia sp. CJK-A8-3]